MSPIIVEALCKCKTMPAAKISTHYRHLTTRHVCAQMARVRRWCSLRLHNVWVGRSGRCGWNFGDVGGVLVAFEHGGGIFVAGEGR